MANATLPDLSFAECYEKVLANLTAVESITYLLSTDENTDQVMLDAVNHAHNVAGEGADVLRQLWERHREDYEKKPVEGEPAAEWTGASMEKELRALAKRIVELPTSGISELTYFMGSLHTAKVNEHDEGGEPNRITMAEIRSLLARDIRPEHVHAFWWLKDRGVAALVPEDDRTPTPDELHTDCIAEIREEYPDADEREVKLRVAIRESITMTPDEEDSTYDKIAKALEPDAQ